jgi:hypothetical protein
VTIDAPFHFDRLLKLHDVLLHHIAVAAFALHLGGCVRAVAEEYKIGRFVNPARGNFPVRHVDVTDAALLHRRKSSQVASGGFAVAAYARELQGRMFLVIERLRFARGF